MISRVVNRKAGGLRARHGTDHVTNSRSNPIGVRYIQQSTCCGQQSCVHCTGTVRSISAELPLEELRFVQESQVSHSQTNQFLTLASASVAWEYLIDDAKMGIFRAIDTGWMGGFLDGLPILLLQSSGRARGRWYRAPLRGTPRVPRLGGPRFAGPPIIRQFLYAAPERLAFLAEKLGC